MSKKPKDIDYDVLVRLFVGLGRKSDSDLIALKAIRDLHQYLSETGQTTKTLLQALTTDYYVERISQLERTNSALVARLAEIEALVPNAPAVPPRPRVKWESHEVAFACELKSKGIPYREIALELNKTYQRTFTKSHIVNLFNRDLKN